MSTRSVVSFAESGRIAACVYVHTDGDPEGEAGRLADLKRFFEAVEEQTTERRFYDAEYLAAKLVVYKALEYSKYSMRVYQAAKAAGKEGSPYEPPYPAGGEPRPLDFLSVGVTTTTTPDRHGDLEFEYLVNTDEQDDKGRPTVYWRPVSAFEDHEWRQGDPEAART